MFSSSLHTVSVLLMAPLKEINPSAATTWLWLFCAQLSFSSGILWVCFSMCACLCVHACVCAYILGLCRKLLPAQADVRDGFTHTAANSHLSFQGL